MGISNDAQIDVDEFGAASAELKQFPWDQKFIAWEAEARYDLEFRIGSLEQEVYTLRRENAALQARIAELEAKIRHNALWQASEDAEERAHLEKLVPDLKKRIAELEGKIDQLTAHDATERQDDKWIQEVQE